MDEEAQKRNTDCVYFLASPLTCKKGNECEYRHSEIARLNPRDCWYWLGGNCLNPHCAFRHPPLEGRPSTSAPGSLSASGISNTLKVPCYYFFQGYCAKGDKCSFMHGPHLGGNPGASAAQKPTKVSSTGTGTETQPQLVEKVATIGSDNGSIKLAPRPSTSMEVQLPTKAENTVRAGSQPPPTKTSQHTPEPALPEAEFMRESLPDALIDTVNFVSKSRVCDSEPTDDWLQDDMETEEWLDESSSGFDVLVNDGCKELGYREDADYLSTNFDMEPGRESTYCREKGICITDELARYDCDHLRVHDQLGYVEAGGWSDHGLCDPYELLAQGHSAYDHVNGHKRKTFDGMASEGTVVSERRGLLREGYSQQSKNVDLRSHLAKRRRVDRRQIADYSRRELHSGFQTCDFQHVHRQWDDEQRHHDVLLRQQQGMRCTKMPLRGRMSWGSGSISRESFHGMELEFEGCLKRVHLRSSPGRHGNGEHFRSRHKEKGRGRVGVETAAPSESSCFRTQSVNKNGTINAMTDFARPKTLEQIKEEKRRAGLLENVCKVADSMAEPKNSIQFGLHGLQGVIQKSQFQPQQNLPDEERKISLGKVVVLESSKIPSFQGPKPLSAILKAKQMSVNDDHVAPGISRELEWNGNTETLGIRGKTNPLSPGSEENVEVELVQGAKYMFEATTDIQNEDLRPANGPADFRLLNSSIQENGRPVLRSNNRIENIILNEAINGHADDAVVGMEPQKSEDEGKTWEHMWEQDGDEEYLYGDEDDFARRLQGFVS